MAKKGTVQRIVDISMEDFNRLNTEQTKKALANIRREITRRVNILKETPDVVSSFVDFKGLKPNRELTNIETGRFDINKAKAELKRGINVLKSKTITPEGAEEVRQRVINDLNLREGVTNRQIANIYKNFHKLQEEYPALLTEAAGGVNYGTIKQKVGRWLQNKKGLPYIRDQLEKIYTEQQRNDAEIAARIESEF